MPAVNASISTPVWAVVSARGDDRDAVRRRGEGDLDDGQGQRMTERDELARSLGGHDPGELGGDERVTLRQIAEPGRRLGAHPHHGAGDGPSPAVRLGARRPPCAPSRSTRRRARDRSSRQPPGARAERLCAENGDPIVFSILTTAACGAGGDLDTARVTAGGAHRAGACCRRRRGDRGHAAIVDAVLSRSARAAARRA